jgi:protein-S-isoprenylcysteine O-methyltransferase Ste14
VPVGRAFPDIDVTKGVRVPTFDLALYGMHAVYWLAFAVARLASNSMQRRAGTTRVETANAGNETGHASKPVADATIVAPHSRLLVAVHGIGFGLMYFAIADAVVFGHVDEWLPMQRAIGAIVIVAAAALAAWSVLSFVSWRLRAKLDVGHQLATGGPFRFMRHPIYMSFNLLALGTAIWAPSWVAWVALVLMAIGGDLRARVEEPLLRAAFGNEYERYSSRTRRFIPGVY